MTELVDGVREGSTQGALQLRVNSLSLLCTGVRQVVLTAVDGRPLPSFTPGSNISVEWGDGRRNSYSLTGPSVEPDHYAISVRLDEAGRGGSRWVHGLSAGDRVAVGRPRSAFAPILAGRHHVLVAGGIGVTPILSHVRAAVDWGRSFEVLYAFRDGFGAHVDDLTGLCGDRLTTYNSSGALRTALGTIFADRPIGTHVYSCGPLSMIGAVADAATSAGWPNQRIHSEAFGAGSSLGGGLPFAAKLGRSGVLVPVPAATTLLQALLDKGIGVANLCRQGVCGECRLSVRGGQIDHRDLYLTDEEKSAGDSIMPCVSRAAGDLLELEL